MYRNAGNLFLRKIIFVLVAAILSSCASYEPPTAFEADQAREAEAAPMSAVVQRKPTVNAGFDKTSTATAATTDNTSRKIHYEGNIELLVSNPRATIKKIVDVVNEQKGYVERITDDTVVIQVPVKSFDTAFKDILAFGKVLQKLVTTADITKEYRSTELRLKIAKATRERLLALLAKASTEEDKLQLLKQIEEVTATIQSLESQFELLKTKVDYSKITVRLKTYDQFDSRYRDYEPLGFDWINDLAPFNDPIASSGDKLEFREPAGMLHIKDNKRYWLAESGDKVLFRATKLLNEPKGEREFWRDAIKLRLSPKYKSVESVNVGAYELLRLESYDDKPEIYYVGLKVDKDALKLVELYFPSVTLEEKYKKSVFDSIRKGET